MPPGATVTVTIVVDVASSAEGTLVNKASVSSDNEHDVSNNSDMAMTTVTPKIDLAIAKTDSRDPVEPGESFSYTLNVTNNGPSRATGVTLVDMLPASGVTYQSASTPPVGNDGRNLEFDLGELASGQTKSITIHVAVDPNFTGTLLNVANVAADQGETNLANNRAEAPTQVNVQPASVGGTVFVDRDNDGQRDAGEQPLPNVAITLTGTDFRGQPVARTTTTNASGRYHFANLMPGMYSIAQSTQPLRYKDGKDAIGDNGDGIPTGADGFKALDQNARDDRDADAFEGIVLGGGSNGREYNFGELALNVSKADFIGRVIYR
jgi:uncharacterized repeat protein (TIGR01451 family)